MCYNKLRNETKGKNMRNKEETVFITFEQAQDLVDRIAQRAEQFNHVMSQPEKNAMAQLLSDCGVNVSDLIDVSNLADNYAINAELVNPDEAENYDRQDLNDSLFSWEDRDGTHYCIQW